MKNKCLFIIFVSVLLFGCAENSAQKTASTVEAQKATAQSDAAAADAFGRLSLQSFYEGDLETALSYADKALKDKRRGKKFGYLKARILLGQKKDEEALKLMESSFKAVPQDITQDDLRTYMFLLADSGRFDDCRRKLDLYIDRFGYFEGLGQFASIVYENTGDYFKSVLFAFWDFEYVSCFANSIGRNDISIDAFLSNMEKLVASVKGTKKEDETLKAVRCIEFLYKTDVDLPQVESDFFLYKFIAQKKQILEGNCTVDAVTEYLKLEKYFSAFPSYYWNIYCAIKAQGTENLKNFSPVLEKAINTGYSTEYSRLAKLELAELNNIPKEAAQKLLTSAEVYSLLAGFHASSDRKLLSPVYELLDLPDCSYVYSAVAQLKDFRTKIPLDAVLREQFLQSSGRLKDRLSFILN
ncbi:hypothetical protein HRQ91_11235 [Treponema parvum]|uniref:Lipoprotein n=1 Tax=Treponema parvum TaxID=138851 RepID=A0A975F5Y3_9SPIR|nr:hypothetical protein [Treponema parvum]QTQ14987.1 hypothetical protein HRQ91_11235 [Treponema parvum]